MRVHALLLTFITAAALGTCATNPVYSMPNACSVGFCQTIVRGASVDLIVADLNDPNLMVDIGLPTRGISHSETFGSFVNRDAPIAAVTGTYFDTRTLIPTGSIVVRGEMVHENSIGAAVCFTPDNRVKFVDASYGAACDLSGAESGMRTGPRLIANGAYALNPGREGFHHPGLFGERTRMVLGVTAHSKLLLAHVRTPVTFGKAAGIMRTLGAVDAICLDGGTSSAMYYRGRIIQRPGRMLTNIIEIRERPAPQSPLAPAVVIKASSDGAAIQSAYGNRRVRISARPIRNQDEPKISEQVAVLAEPVRLRLAKGLHALFPVYGA